MNWKLFKSVWFISAWNFSSNGIYIPPCRMGDLKLLTALAKCRSNWQIIKK